MTEEQTENQKSDQEKIADLIVENQILRHKACVLAELAIGASKVLDYYASSKLFLPVFTLIDHSMGDKQPLFSESKYKIIEVDSPGPDKEIMVGKEMYDLKIDTETAERASKQILDMFKELDITIEDKTEEEPEEDLQLHLEI